MILYFTGTGNSKYVADALAVRLHDSTLSLNDALKYNRPLDFVSDRPFILVAPIYAWRLPHRIEDLIRSARFSGSDKIYFVPTMGGQSGNADKYCKKICDEIGLSFMGLRGVVMPDNYIRGYEPMAPEKVPEVLQRARSAVDTVAETIEQGSFLTKTDKTPFGGFLSSAVNLCFDKYIATDKQFTVSDRCVGCGKCARLCPLNNIKLSDGKPSFSGRCMACYACIHSCLSQAIDIKGKTEKKRRYLCPPYEE